MKPVLLTVSGSIAADLQQQIEQGKRPRADYIALRDSLNADLLDYTQARRESGWFGKLLEKLGGPNLMLAWRCFQLRRKYRVIFTDGEQVGLPLAMLLMFLSRRNRPRHLMIVHILSVGKKMIFFDLFGLAKYVDTFFTYATWQKNFIESRWKVPPERVVFTPFMVDADFFTPSKAQPQRLPELADNRTPMISAVGLEFRDYPTLMEAVKGLDVKVVIAAASPWSKRSSSAEGQEIPENVIVRRYSQHELRDVYAASRFVVMPLYNVNFQAGVTAILEAMAMEKAVVCSRTNGQTDVIVDGETGVYVPPQDPQALRKAIVRLLEAPQEADEMGKKGRQRILKAMSLNCYAERFAAYLRKESLT